MRIDFAGGWTDIPPFAEAEGGAVVNAAITRYVRGVIARPDETGILRALRSDRSYLSYSLDVPIGAGLGASAAQTVLWSTMVRATVSNSASRETLAEIACGISALLGILGGKQDEYASALGGINFLTFGRTVGVEPVLLPQAPLQELRGRLVLAYSGVPRLSPLVHARVWERYRAGEPGVTRALRELKRVAYDMRVALLAGDLHAFATLINENWSYQRALDPAVMPPAIQNLIQVSRDLGAVAAKACGAGGGGCVLLVARRGEGEALAVALRQRRIRIIDFDFDTYGVFLKKG